MSGNAIAKFFATVEFKAITKDLDNAVGKLKKDLNAMVGGMTAKGSPLTKAKERMKTLQLKEKQILQEYQNQLAKNKIDTAKMNAEKKKFEFAGYKQEQNLLRQKRRNEELNQRSRQRIMENESKLGVLRERGVIEQARAMAAQARAEAMRIRSSMGLSNRTGTGNAALTGGVGGLTASGAGGGLALGAAAFKSYNVGNFMVSREPQFEFLTGDATKAADAIKFVDSEAKRLSLNLVQANDQYKQLLASGATSIGIPQTEKLFSRFSELSTMLGLSEDAQARGVRAFGQIDFVW